MLWFLVCIAAQCTSFGIVSCERKALRKKAYVLVESRLEWKKGQTLIRHREEVMV